MQGKRSKTPPHQNTNQILSESLNIPKSPGSSPWSIPMTLTASTKCDCTMQRWVMFHVFLCKLAANNYYTFARHKDETFWHPKRCHVPKLSAPPPLRLRQTLVGRRLPCITQWFGLSQGWSYEFMTDAWHDLCKPLQPHVTSISFLLIYFLFTSFMTCNIIHLPFPCNAKQPVTTPPFVSMKKRGGKTFPVTESMLMPWWRLKQREGDTWNRGKTEAPSTHGSQVQSFSETLGTICTSGKSWKTIIACGNFTTSFKSSTPLSPKIAWNILKRKGPKPLIFEDWILQSDSCCNSQPLIRSPYIYKSDCRLPIFCHPNPFKVGT